MAIPRRPYTREYNNSSFERDVLHGVSLNEIPLQPLDWCRDVYSEIESLDERGKLERTTGVLVIRAQEALRGRMKEFGYEFDESGDITKVPSDEVAI